MYTQHNKKFYIIGSNHLDFLDTTVEGISTLLECDLIIIPKSFKKEFREFLINNGKKIIHLEAGLRSGNLKDPYPEEMNRQVISRLADIHLCPTEFNKENLLKENVSGDIYVVGNTGLDNISKEGCEYNNKVLITMHRRDLGVDYQTKATPCC